MNPARAPSSVLVAFWFLSLLPPALIEATVTFTSPPSLNQLEFQSPAWQCLANVPEQVEGTYQGRLLCWHDMISTPESPNTEQALQQMVDESVFVIDTSNLTDGHIPPFFEYTKRDDLVMEWIARSGAKGIIITQTAARRGGSMEVVLNNLEYCKNLGILVVELGVEDGTELSKICRTARNQTVNVVVKGGDINEWNVFKKGPFITAFRIIGTIIAGICAGVAITKLVALWRLESIRLQPTQIILGLHLIASIFRMVYIALDPIYAGLLFNGVAAHMTATISFPIYPICTLLLVLVWTEAMDESKVKITNFLPKTKIPFLVFSFLLFLGELISSALRAARIGYLIVGTTIISVIYVLTIAILTLLFFIVGGKVLNRIRALRADVGTAPGIELHVSRTRLRRMTVILVSNGIINVVWILGFILSAIDTFAYFPVGFHVCWSLLYGGILLGSLTQCLAIRMPAFNLDSHSGSLSVASADTSELQASSETPPKQTKKPRKYSDNQLGSSSPTTRVSLDSTHRD